jgi:NitT/TauT family transport system substrate-binding protein
MHEILLRETLTRQGISPDKDVHLVRVDFFDMGMALSRGSIDAFLSGEPFPTLAVNQGYGRILSYPYYDESVGTINAGMLVRQKQATPMSWVNREKVLMPAVFSVTRERVYSG